MTKKTTTKAAVKATPPATTTAAPTPTVTTTAPDHALIGSGKQPSDVQIADGKTVPLGDVVGRAYKDSGLTVEDWNKLAEDDREARIEAAIEAMRADEANNAGGDNKTTDTKADDKPEDKPNSAQARTYVVQWDLKYHGERYVADDEIELTDDELEAFGKSSVIKLKG